MLASSREMLVGRPACQEEPTPHLIEPPALLIETRTGGFASQPYGWVVWVRKSKGMPGRNGRDLLAGAARTRSENWAGKRSVSRWLRWCYEGGGTHVRAGAIGGSGRWRRGEGGKGLRPPTPFNVPVLSKVSVPVRLPSSSQVTDWKCQLAADTVGLRAKTRARGAGLVSTVHLHECICAFLGRS